MPDRPSKSGSVSIQVDFRNPLPEGKEFSNNWRTDTPDADKVALLFNVLTELAGPGADVIFDFGTFTIRDINLDTFVERFAGDNYDH